MSTPSSVITIEAIIQAPTDKVWKTWSEPEHIMKWNNASEDWHTTKAENDLRAGGKFLSRMEAKDGSFGFDFAGIYTHVKPHELISYTMTDGRKVTITFRSEGMSTHIKSEFEAENENPEDMQKAGWQAILDNFKKYVEA